MSEGTNSLRNLWKTESSSFLPNLIGGVVAGSVTIVLAISFSALIYSGPLEPYVNHGAGLLLAGAVLMLTICALFSSYPALIATHQDSAAAILALMAAAIMQSMSANTPIQQVFVTVVASIMITTLLVGIVFWILGRLKLGRLIRFIPYPVIGGFLAATGLLLVRGGFSVMLNDMPEILHLNLWFQPTILSQFLPGLIFAVTLLMIYRRSNSVWILPGMIVLMFLIFHAWRLVSSYTIQEAVSMGLLLGPFESGSFFIPITPSSLRNVDWGLILQQADKIASILMISVVSLLLNASSIELTTRRDLDLNHELETAGIGNLISGLAGASVGYHILAESLLLYKIGARSQIAPLVAALLCGVVLIFGAGIIMLFPKALLGGLLLFLGLAFLVEWLVDAYSQLSLTDYIIVWIILIVSGAVGFLQAIAVGLLIAVALFVINYSRTDVVRATLSGANFMSAVDRSAAQRHFLREVGDQTVVFQLQGYIFFGTAFSLLTKIRERIEMRNLPEVRYMILNFTRVSGLDSSASSSFLKMSQLAEKMNIHILMARLPEDMIQHLVSSGFCDIEAVRLHFFATLDEAMEWCEDRLLASMEDPGMLQPQTVLLSELNRIFNDPIKEFKFLSYLEKIQASTGERLIEQGDPGNALFLVDSGAAEVRLRLPDQHEIRLRTIRSGAIFGEIGFYLGEPRSASVVATFPSTLYRLQEDSLRRMEAENPELAAGLHKWLAAELAERLVQNNLTLASLMD